MCCSCVYRVHWLYCVRRHRASDFWVRHVIHAIFVLCSSSHQVREILDTEEGFEKPEFSQTVFYGEV
jgi:hypothetical protein